MSHTVSSAASPKGFALEQERRALAYAKKGILIAIISGIVFSLNSLLIRHGRTFAPFDRQDLFLLIPLVCVGINDLCAGAVTTARNAAQGRLPEVWRSLKSRPGRYVIGGAMIGAILGMGSYMTALQLVGPAYVLPLTSLYPAVAAVLAVFVLKERIRPLAWFGLACCVVGAIVIGYTPPVGQENPYFYLGLAFAVLTAVGWGTEGVCATFGMDFIHPEIALNVYYLVSVTLFWGILIPVASVLILPSVGGWDAVMAFVQSRGLKFLALAGVVGSISYACWYLAMNMTGVSRGMAINISYALWGIVFSSFFTGVVITANLIVGALAIFGGMFFVIGNPKDMLNLRKVE